MRSTAEWLITGAIVAAILAASLSGGGGQREVRTFGPVENVQVQVTD